jgi:hypothetical protein
LDIKNIRRVIFQWLTGIGASASLIVFIDRYFLHASLADALLIPVSIPTGVFALILALTLILLFFAIRHMKTEHETTRIENTVNTELQSKLAQCEGNTMTLENKLEEYKSLENKIFALLLPSTYGLSIYEMKNHLGSNVTTDDVLSALAELERQGKVTQGKLDGYYALKKL